jgi:hypothetical protein
MESLLETVLIISTAIVSKVRLVLCGKTASALVQTAWYSLVFLIVQPDMAAHAHTFASVHLGITYVAVYTSFANDCFAASPDV